MRLVHIFSLIFLTFVIGFMSAALIIPKEHHDKLNLPIVIKNIQDKFGEIFQNLTNILEMYVNISLDLINLMINKFSWLDNKSLSPEDQGALKILKTRFNFASLNGGAKILGSNPGCISAKSILDDKRDT